MRRLLRILMWTLSLLTIAAVAGVAWNWERLVRLYNVNHLFDEKNIVANFSSMKDLFFWTPIPRSGEVIPWPEDKTPIAATYAWEGQEKPVAAWLEKTRTTSLLAVSDGRIAFEEYYLGTSASDRRISWSMAKSFLSALFGIAVAEGNIPDLSAPVDSRVPALKGTVYEGVSIRNVLNMASGVRFNEDYLDFNSDINRMGRVLALGGSMNEFAASLEGREREAGKLRQYTSIDTHVLAMVLEAATGRKLPELMGDRLLSKLGPESEAYYLTDGFGVAFALGGINMTSRDYARFGQMMLDMGRFAGREVIPSGWALVSVKASAPPSADPADKFGYGYQWWVPERANGEFYAIGIYGQYIYVNRPARVVIVKTSADRGFRDDGASGNRIEAETIEMFRAIAAGLSSRKRKT
jgi:hypothetical protein